MVWTRVFAYVLLFVIKCRFPANKSIAEIVRCIHWKGKACFEWQCHKCAFALVHTIDNSNSSRL